MTTWFHAAILATGVVATAAVGLASASAYKDEHFPLAQKTDRLAFVANSAVSNEITIEKRIDGISILTRVPAPVAD
ncbi:MAG: hypothetical protein J0H11_12470 [Rhizobiales bacterium]|nr:hypothetical protein [Hyphomicrobiales bacterium]